MNITQLNLLFAPTTAFPTLDPDSNDIAIQVQIDAGRVHDGDLAGTVAVNLTPGDADNATSMKRLVGLTLHSLAHMLLAGTVMDETRTTPTPGGGT